MGGSSGYSNGARKQAAQILSQPPFTPGHHRGFAPLRGVLTTIGRWIGDVWFPVWHAIDRYVIQKLFVRPFRHVFGVYDWIPLAVIALLAGAAVAILLIRRRTRIGVTVQATKSRAERAENPDELEAAATTAETAGDFNQAVRLRFRAGLLRLELLDAIHGRETATTRQLQDEIKSTTFDKLATLHEVTAYAGVRATATDSAAARDEWHVLLSEASAAHRDASRHQRVAVK